MYIKFSRPYHTGKEIEYMKDIFDNHLIESGDGKYTKLVSEFIEKRYGTAKALLTTSCTTALEFAIRLSNLLPGDEVIVPSFTFSSTVNAILLSQGLKVVFADVTEDTLNIDSKDVKKKITKNTKAIMVVHYAGVACDMDAIMKLAKKHKLIVIEDAAQAIESEYKGKPLGTIGDFGCLSFHETKNITCGEGGALLINNHNEKTIQQAEIMREKGTNRSLFLQGIVDKYTWVDIGSSYLPSDMLAAYLYAQLEAVEKITKMRLKVYAFYKKMTASYVEKELITIPHIPSFAKHNAHIFYMLCRSNAERNTILGYLRKEGVGATFHYIPLHSAPQGQKLGYKAEDLPVTEDISGRLLRLPLYPDMTKEELKYIQEKVKEAFALLEDTMETKKDKDFEQHNVPFVSHVVQQVSSFIHLTKRLSA